MLPGRASMASRRGSAVGCAGSGRGPAVGVGRGDRQRARPGRWPPAAGRRGGRLVGWAERDGLRAVAAQAAAADRRRCGGRDVQPESGGSADLVQAVCPRCWAALSPRAGPGSPRGGTGWRRAARRPEPGTDRSGPGSLGRWRHRERRRARRRAPAPPWRCRRCSAVPAVPYRTTRAARPLVGPPRWSSTTPGRRPRTPAGAPARRPDGALVRDPPDPDDVGPLAARRVRRRPAARTRSTSGRAAWGSRGPSAGLRRRPGGPGRRGPGPGRDQAAGGGLLQRLAARLRAGVDLPAVHAPVADGERLRAASGALTEALLTGLYSPARPGARPVLPLARDPSARTPRRTPPPPPHTGGCGSSGRPRRRCRRLDRALFLIRPHLVPLTCADRASSAARRMRAVAPMLDLKPWPTRGSRDVRDELPAWAGQLSVGASGSSWRTPARPLPVQHLLPEQLPARGNGPRSARRAPTTRRPRSRPRAARLPHPA